MLQRNGESFHEYRQRLDRRSHVTYGIAAVAFVAVSIALAIWG